MPRGRKPANSVFELADRPIQPRTPPPERAKAAPAPRQHYDPLQVPIHSGVPLPDAVRRPAKHSVLWARMAPGDMVELPLSAARGLVVHARKVGSKAALRSLDKSTARVWRLE